MRQLWWAAIPVWSLGVLSFVPFLRIALLRHHRRDWAIAAAYIAATGAFIATFPFADRSTVGIAGTTF